eukprot:4528888-Prymnesium_polylepis.1
MGCAVGRRRVTVQRIEAACIGSSPRSAGWPPAARRPRACRYQPSPSDKTAAAATRPPSAGASA